MTPLISIIIPVWGRCSLLDSCLASIAAQTYHNIEIIVVDDGNDPPIGNLKSQISNLKFFRQTHQGAPAARNRGFQASCGAYLLFCDADVTLRPTAIERMVAALEKRPDIAYVYSAFRWGWKKFPCVDFSADILRQQNFIHTTTLIRREYFPGFDESLTKFQDWDLWLTMLAQGHRGFGIRQSLFRVIPGGIFSRWAPSFWYRIPSRRLRYLWPGIRRYETARAIIINKHRLIVKV